MLKVKKKTSRLTCNTMEANSIFKSTHRIKREVQLKPNKNYKRNVIPLPTYLFSIFLATFM